MDRAAWQVTVHAVSKSPTQLSDLSLLHSKKANKINRYIFMPRIYPGMDTRVKANYSQFSLVQSLSFVGLLWPHGLQHAASLPYPSPTPGVCSNSCLLNQWCHPNHLILCLPLLLPSIFPSIRVFSNESVLCIWWPKYWSFSFNISPSNEYSGLIFQWIFRTDFL